MTASTVPGWWRRNRWGLIALPLAVAASLGASSDRVRAYYWQDGLHDAQTAEQGAWLGFRSTSFDADGEHPLDVDVRLDSVEEVPVPVGIDPLDVPAGARLVQVGLSFRAEPDVPLIGCTVALVDTDGTRYEPNLDFTSSLPTVSCVPADAPGPSPALGALDDTLGTDDSPTRPDEWTVLGLVLVPTDVTITEALVWWQMPDHARLTLG